jgi:hypothetical protein
VVVDDGKGYGGGKHFEANDSEDQSDEYESDRSINVVVEQDFETLHFYYNYKALVSQLSQNSPLLY